jgi:copper chaperone
MRIVDMKQEPMRNYTVDGMSCEHCRLAVAEEVGAVGGVEAVTVDLETGAVGVHGAGFTDDEVAAAVAEAGYTVRR